VIAQAGLRNKQRRRGQEQELLRRRGERAGVYVYVCEGIILYLWSEGYGVSEWSIMHSRGRHCKLQGSTMDGWISYDGPSSMQQAEEPRNDAAGDNKSDGWERVRAC
jgi:hypothetical protein